MFDKLVIRAKDGDVEAKEEIILKLQPLILSSLQRYYYKRKEFYDLVQEGNLKVLECIEDYQPCKGVPFLGYVKAMLRYMYLDKHKEILHSSLNVKLEGEEYEMVDLLLSDDKDMLESLVDQEEIKDLGKVLGLLTPRQKQIILLYYMEGMSQKDIACELDISYRTVINIKASAIKKLRKAFKYL